MRAPTARPDPAPAAVTTQLTVAQIWWHASRPATLAASVSPVLVGLGVAAHLGPVSPIRTVGVLVVAMALQFGVNYANDYSDFVRGADTPARVGPPRAAASGLVPPRYVLWAALTSFLIAAAVGTWLCWLTSWWLLAVGAACILAAWMYTGGPRPYGYRGYGELAVFVFFGLVATTGTTFVESGRLVLLAVLAGILPGALASAILMVNNIRDMAGDRLVGKRTLAVIVGPRHARWLLFGMLGLALITPPLVVILALHSPAVFLTWLAIPLVVGPLRNSASTNPKDQIRALKQMGALLAASASLLGLGIWVG